MKIEIGESLLYSWLRHVKMCRLVQMNWKPSQKWLLQKKDKEILESFMQKTADHFKAKYAYDIYKNTKNLSQFLQQAEIDVLGMNMDNAELLFFAVDVAFHSSGTTYTGKNKTNESETGGNETTKRIIKKILRSAMCLYGHIGSGEIIFAAPKISPSVMRDLNEPLEDIKQMFKDFGFNFTATIIANQNFFEQIMEPVLSISDDVKDTTELFLRSHQLMGMFEQGDKKDSLNTASKMPVDLTIAVNNPKPYKKYFLHGKPCTAEEMHTTLVQATEATRTLFYKDGKTCSDIWSTKNYTDTSKLNNNLNTGPLNGWEQKGIVGIEIKID